jgi:hypothetical protein
MTFGCQRIVAATEATITWQPTDQEGEPADPAAAVTVGVKRADGTALVADGAATTGTGDSPRAFALSRAQTAQLDVLVATWRIGATVVATTHHAIVGRRYVSLAEVRQIDPTLLSTETTKNADMLRARDEVETMFEQRTGRAWVPRFSVVEVRPGRPLRVRYLRSVRWVQSVLEDGTTADFATTGLAPAGPWEGSYDHFRVGVEHGRDYPPDDLKRAAVTAIRHQASQGRSGLDARAMSFQPIDGGNVVLATPGLGPWVTGIPAVDEVLKRYAQDAEVGVIRLVPSTPDPYG